jgi:hypothetical protein
VTAVATQNSVVASALNIKRAFFIVGLPYRGCDRIDAVLRWIFAAEPKLIKLTFVKH